MWTEGNGGEEVMENVYHAYRRKLWTTVTLGEMANFVDWSIRQRYDIKHWLLDFKNTLVTGFALNK